MPTFEVIWTPRALEKLADNDVSPDEFEQVLRRARTLETSISSGYPACRGRIGTRILFCVFEFVDELRILPVTAFWIHED